MGTRHAVGYGYNTHCCVTVAGDKLETERNHGDLTYGDYVGGEVMVPVKLQYQLPVKILKGVLSVWAHLLGTVDPSLEGVLSEGAVSR